MHNLLKIKRLSPTICMPTRGTSGSAGIDIRYSGEHEVYLEPGDSITLETGIAMAIPEGYFGLICARSSLGVKYDIDSHYGVIDSDYRGEVKLHLRNLSHDTFLIMPGDKCAQMVLLPVPAIEITEVGDLDDTERGEGGFGSTGR